MKKKLAAVLLVMLILLTACSPGNILTAKPEDIESEPAAGALQSKSQADDETTGAQTGAEQDDTQAEEQTQPETTEGQAPETVTNPVLDPNRTANTEAKSTIAAEGLVKDVTASDLSGKTINLFLSEAPAFSYKNAAGETVDEFDWLDSLKESSNIDIKYKKINQNGLITYQNIAQKAGIALDLVQVRASDFLTGLTACSAMDEYINIDALESMDGVSARVFSLSGNRFLSPKGVGLALWYNKDILSENGPDKLFEQDSWTFAEFEQLYSTVNSGGKYLYETSSWLSWGAASGVLPVAYSDGEVVNNLDKGALIAAFNNLLNLNASQNFVNTAESGFIQGNVAMSYGTAPVNTNNINIGWAPIPKANADGMYVLGFNGTSFGLPKHQSSPDNTAFALEFAHMWCNRYTESSADSILFDTKLSAADFSAYYTAVETYGQFVAGDSEIASIFNTKSKFNESLYNKDYNFEVELQAARQLLDVHIERINNRL